MNPHPSSQCTSPDESGRKIFNEDDDVFTGEQMVSRVLSSCEIVTPQYDSCTWLVQDAAAPLTPIVQRVRLRLNTASV